MAASYLNSITTFLEKPSSPFTNINHQHPVTSGLMSSVRKDSNMTACCHSKGNQWRPNGSPPISSNKRSPTAAIEDSLIFSENKEEMGLLDLMPCNGTNGMSTSVCFESGIGITRYLRGKSFFITGATGFLAKVLIEKILRTAPDVGKIYVLIKAKNKETALARMKNEIINIELFRSLQETHGNNYQAFMMRKLIPVIGNVRESNMGIEATQAEEISEKVDIIVNSAANTTFDERYDVALDTNTIGPFRLMSFAKRFKRLKLFLQVSTAYVNGKRQGRVLEKPFRIGDTIAKELVSPQYSAESTPFLDIEAEIRLAFGSKKAIDDVSLIQEMKDLGLKRANIYGWQDTYVFTKAMGEMVINSLRGDIPVVTIRPSVIESTWKEPFPGWIEGNRMMDPIVMYYGKGQLTGFLAEPEGVIDVVPADIVVNATLAAMAKHGWTKNSGFHIYHIASSTVNPLVFQELTKFFYQYFKSFPYIDSKGRPIHVTQMKLFNDMNELSSHVHNSLMQRMSTHKNASQKLNNITVKIVDQVMYLANIYEPYTFYRGRFDTMNARNLIAEMSEEEKREFGFDVGRIDWEDYISNVHIPGLRRHVMKGRYMRGTSNSELVGALV